MTFRENLAAKVEQIRALAWEKVERHYELQTWPVRNEMGAIARHDWAVVINQTCNSLMTFADMGDPDVFQIIQNGLADPTQLRVDDTILDPSADRDTPLRGGYLTVAENVLAVPEGHLPAVQTLVAGWAGAPAEFLASIFERYGGEPRVLHHQLAYVAELGAIAAACEEVLTRSRDGVLTLCDSAIEKLDNLYSGGLDGSGGGIEFTFVVAGAVASIASAGPWVGAALSLGNYLYGLHSSGGDDPGPEGREIEGAHVDEILTSIGQEVARLQDLAADQVTLIANALDKDLAATEGEQLNTFMFIDPELTQDHTRYGRPGNQSIHLVYENAYRAGRVYLSAAAYHYQAASNRLQTCTARHETGFGQLLSTVQQDFVLLRDTLDGILKHTRDYFQQSGEALCDAVEVYAQQDGINADSLQSSADQFAAQNPDLTTLHELDQRTAASDFPQRGRVF
jgi:hypothetical protein